jgi:hypothetical protein
MPDPLDDPLPVASGNNSPSRHGWLLAAGCMVVVLIVLLAWSVTNQLQPGQPGAAVPQGAAESAQTAEPGAPVLRLDPAHNYGNKYANGLLPVGDGKYSTAAAQKGTVYVCAQFASTLSPDNGGASTRGPWFVNNNTQYDISKKIYVEGDVRWQGNFSNVVNDTTRTITTNDLPLDHTTGEFPIARTDPAYKYDQNPNTISGQSQGYDLAAAPTYGVPQCISNQVGVMLSGVALFNAFDAGGRDAGAWEVQDDCNGHPQSAGQYHYHTLSTCITDVSAEMVIGFALDGFAITGPTVSPGNILTTDDLDECHGITSEIVLDGKKTRAYHYVMTQDFPYSASCFRGPAIQPPGKPEGQGPPETPNHGTR